MRVRNNPNAKLELKQFDKYIADKVILQEILSKNSNKKVNIEIGMGKGKFISKLAYLNPNELYIGIEISDTVLALAAKKIKKFETENNIHLNNLYIISIDAEIIGEYFKKAQIDKIYLNFSDPWPKKKHEKRRLTYKSFLEKYRKILKRDCNIEIKTDNISLFEYTIISVANNKNFKIDNVYLDLHKENAENIMTEYEEKFSQKGPIYKMIIS